MAVSRLALALAMTYGCTASDIAFAQTNGNVAVSLGVGVLREDPTNQPSGGVDVMFGRKTWIVLPCVYFSYSRGEGETAFWSDFAEKNYEAGFGVTKVLGSGSLHPHVGLGFGGLWQEVHVLPGGDGEPGWYTTRDTGLWIEGGLFHTLMSRFNLGAAVSVSGVGSSDTTLGATHARLAIGWGWAP
ncbi:MAG TPA: hypothetical protein VJX91_08780 [Candidatus Eisenbacteria bacterium]|nr:hypothetical protein [Candidatus Eisenbacteria bacterium]